MTDQPSGSLTPAEIHNRIFRKASRGRPAYDGDEVDAFLDEVEQEMLHLAADNRRLRDKLRLDGDAASRQEPTSQQELTALAEQLGRSEQERRLAEEHASAVRAELERTLSAAAVVPDPSRAPAPVVVVAQRTADEYLRGAEQEAAALLSTARDKADQLTSEARLQAATVLSDARHRHTEALAKLSSDQVTALGDIERLEQRAHHHLQALRDDLTRRPI